MKSPWSLFWIFKDKVPPPSNSEWTKRKISSITKFLAIYAPLSGCWMYVNAPDRKWVRKECTHPGSHHSWAKPEVLTTSAQSVAPGVKPHVHIHIAHRSQMFAGLNGFYGPVWRRFNKRLFRIKKLDILSVWCQTGEMDMCSIWGNDCILIPLGKTHGMLLSACTIWDSIQFNLRTLRILGQSDSRCFISSPESKRGRLPQWIRPSVHPTSCMTMLCLSSIKHADIRTDREDVIHSVFSKGILDLWVTRAFQYLIRKYLSL